MVARRLAEHTGKRVLVIEAGPRYPGWALQMPLASLRLRKAWSWNLESVPQPQLNGRRIRFPMGRVVGGTASVNAMVAAAGAQEDFDSWAAAGCPGWAWADLEPCLQRATASAERSLLPVSRPVYESAFSQAFLQACAEEGLRRQDPLSGAEAETCGMFGLFQQRGGRLSAARYLHNVQPAGGLTLLPRTEVRRVVFEGTRAVGVELGGRRGRGQILATEGVIVCAGTILSPRILHSSGIGPAQALEAAGLPVLVDLPGVGQNLQDHVGVPVVVESQVPPPGRPARWLQAAAEWAIMRTGVMASNCCESGCFFGSPGAAPEIEVFTHFQTSRHPRAVEFSVVLMHPQSRGTLTSNPANPWGPPLIDPGFLSSPADALALQAGVARVRSLLQQPALRRFGLGRELLPGGLDLPAFMRAHANTYYHPAGTCRMGSDPLAVVDPRLRVHGLENLWVVDNSIMPTITSSHTAATAIMIGERAADILSADLAHRSAVCQPRAEPPRRPPS